MKDLVDCLSLVDGGHITLSHNGKDVELIDDLAHTIRIEEL